MEPTMNNSLRLHEIKILQHIYNPYTDSYFTTFLFYLPKIVLAEFNTHRQLVRNVASSRAINLKMFREDVDENYWLPTFTYNQKGMQGLPVDKFTEEEAEIVWLRTLDNARSGHESLEKLGIHKQQANRVLEPYKIVPVVASGTEWKHFFTLRASVHADPAISEVAYQMQKLYEACEPTSIVTAEGQVFTPFYPGEVSVSSYQLKTSTARVARTSFEKFNVEDDEDNLRLFNKLAKMRHSTPFEHSVLGMFSKYGEFSLINGEGCFGLPEELKGHLFTYRDRIVYTRQYKGFYTLRSFMEDFPDLPIEKYTGEIN